jgi:thiol-disulfide isomerase/thioredoxin
MIRVLQFSSETCAPCKVQEQILNELANENDLNFIFVKINIDNNLKEVYNVTKVPTLLFLDDEDIIDRFEGLLMKPQLILKLKSIIH